MNLGLQGKRALVTGSSSGIGAGIAKTAASEGISVVVHGRNVARVSSVVDEIRQSGATAVAVVGDLATEDGAAAVAEAARSSVGSTSWSTTRADRRRPKFSRGSHYRCRNGAPLTNGTCFPPAI